MNQDDIVLGADLNADFDPGFNQEVGSAIDMAWHGGVGSIEGGIEGIAPVTSSLGKISKTISSIRVGCRVGWRLSNMFVHLILGFLMMLVLGFWIKQDGRIQKSAVSWWLRRVCDIFKVEVEVVGEPTNQSQLVVSNHISWLDIPILGGLKSQRFLAKSEVKSWPVIGTLASWAGTVYIRRGAGESKTVANTIGKKIYDGNSVLVFPEGTSTDGKQVRRYYSNLFKAASVAGCTVQPIAIVYNNAEEENKQIAFIGDDEFHHHLVKIAKLSSISVQVYFLPELDPSIDKDCATPAALADFCWRCTSELLSVAKGGVGALVCVLGSLRFWQVFGQTIFHVEEDCRRIAEGSPKDRQ